MPPTDDDPLVIEYELPDAAASGEIGFAFFNIEVRLPVNGRWVFVVTWRGWSVLASAGGEWLTQLAEPRRNVHAADGAGAGPHRREPQMWARQPRS